MYYTLQDLQQLKEPKKLNDEQAQADRHYYIQGREGYPTEPPASLDARQWGCYMMGFNTSEALTTNEHIGCEW